MATQVFSVAFLDFLDETLFMPNEILKSFYFENIDFHQKFTKIEDFKVDDSKKLLKFSNREFLYRKSYSKFDGFWGLLINIVLYFFNVYFCSGICTENFQKMRG